ncbi:hypothetical protein BUALT_Bualt18G0082500 [Buddleja alternifolia]|uniref:Uncharacterized protein n=1 Tax=Buddleja alternifolia TaxID=168488 RepID=A0AAV6WE39_9LAMI|nr:hypothetical protein BUALT_Bualt18G0082500 [Buddleja alternifolia]
MNSHRLPGMGRFFGGIYVYCSWRDVESTPLDNIYWDDSHAFINGIIYWFCQYDFLFNRPAANFIVFFDFESEIFWKIDAPPGFDEYRLQRRYSMNIGIGGDLLCLVDIVRVLIYGWWTSVAVGTNNSVALMQLRIPGLGRAYNPSFGPVQAALVAYVAICGGVYERNRGGSAGRRKRLRSGKKILSIIWKGNVPIKVSGYL